MLKIASWNVNSIKVRLEQVLSWLTSSAVDVLALQETKVIDQDFPKQAFENAGYQVAFSGQKTYNGVAIVSRYPIEELIVEHPNYTDPQRRFICATIAGIRVMNWYVPNGSEIGSEKYLYKLEWLKAMSAHLQDELNRFDKLVLMGDFNIAPADEDVYDPAAWEGSILVSEQERKAFFDILELGLVDSFRQFPQEEHGFSWWDYRAASFRRNLGLRIDHILLTNALNQICTKSQIDKQPRSWERPSDHAPVVVELK